MEQRPGLDLDQALMSVGLGWSALVWSGWELIHDAGGVVTSVGRSNGLLRFYYLMPPAVPQVVYDALRVLEADSSYRCEICGGPGSPYPNQDTTVIHLLPALRDVRITCPDHTARRRAGEDWSEMVAEIARMAEQTQDLLGLAESEPEPAPRLYLEEEKFDLDTWRRLAGIEDNPDTSDWGVGWSVERDLEDEEEDYRTF